MYDFREITPFTGSDDNQRPAEAMLIDGQYIEDLIPGYSTLQVSGRELLSQSIEKQTIGKSDGEFIQYVHNPSREIVVGYRLAAADNLSFRQAFYKLNDILHGENHQVSFNDDPSKYWLATLSDIDDVPKGRNAITSSFTLFVPDGIAHSVATKTFDNMPYKDVPVNQLRNTGFGRENSSDWNPSIWATDGTITNQDGIITSVNTGKAIIQHTVSQSESSWIASEMTVTISVYVKGKGSVTSGYFNGSDWEEDSQPQQADFDDYVQLNFTRVIKAVHLDAGSPRFSINTFCPNSTMQTKLLKVELGSTVSPWSPNPADPEYYTNTITVHNGGTYPVEPVITATMQSDNGVLALINEENGGVLQFGDAEQVDGEEKQKSEQVVDYAFHGGKPDSGLTVNAGNVFFNDSNRSKIKGGFVSSITKDAVVPTFVGTSSDRWNGPTLHSDIPTTAEGVNTGNFLFKNRANFKAAVGHIGRIEFILNSPDGIAMVFVMRDATITKKQMIIESWCMGQQLDQREVDLGSLNSDFFEVQMGRIGSQLLFQIAKISKLNGDVPVYASKIMLTPSFSNFANVPITSMTTWFATFGNHTASSMALTDSKFIWSNINFWQDFSNTFSNGDVLTIDTQSRGIAVNGVNVSGLQSIDNDWEKFKLPPGDNHISINCSSFASMPTVAATIREAYL